MDFRQYDNALGRFHGVDLLAEWDHKGSPYSFGLNNPVYFSDPSGLSVSLYGGGDSFLITANGADAKSMFNALVNAMDGKTTYFTTEDYNGDAQFEVYNSLEEYESMGGGSPTLNDDYEPGPEVFRLKPVIV